MGEAPGKIDPHKSTQIFVCGGKGTGKTELGVHIWDSYPYDAALVDPNGDIKVPDDTHDLEWPIPSRWPRAPIDEAQAATLGRRRKKQTVRWVPDMLDDGYREDMDRVVGLAFGHRRTCLLVDEAQFVAPVGKVLPHTRRALAQGRHQELSSIWITPRPKLIDPLCISNADYVYVFRLAAPMDRARVAENIGWDPKAFDEAVFALGDHEYLRYHAGTHDLAHYPALPEHLIKHHAPG